MTANLRSSTAALRGLERRGAAAFFALTIALGMSGGAFAQCMGGYHASSGAGSHGSAASAGGVHSGASSVHSPSSCASGSHGPSASNLASLHPTGVGPGAAHVGSRGPAYRAAGAAANAKKDVKRSVKP
jgi:hypothetical protein